VRLWVVVDEGLVRYVRERLGEGYQEAEIRAALAQHGHPQEAIDEAFRHIHREGKHTLLPFVLLLLLIAGVVLFLLLRQSAPSHHQAPALNQTPGVKSVPATSSALALAEQLKTQSSNQSEDETYAATVKAAVANGQSVADGILLCSINKETSYKNYCLQELAKEWREPRLCGVIGDIAQRDDCYLGLVFEGEDQYCSKLQLEENKRVCDLLLGNT